MTSPTPPPDPAVLSVQHAAVYAGVSLTRAFALSRDGSWRSIKIGRTRRVFRASIDEWLEAEAHAQLDTGR